MTLEIKAYLSVISSVVCSMFIFLHKLLLNVDTIFAFYNLPNILKPVVPLVHCNIVSASDL